MVIITSSGVRIYYLCSQIIYTGSNLARHPWLVDEYTSIQEQELTIFQSLTNNSFAIPLKPVIQQWCFKCSIKLFSKSWSHKYIYKYSFPLLVSALHHVLHSAPFPDREASSATPQILLQLELCGCRFCFLVLSTLDVSTLASGNSLHQSF